MDTGSYKKPHTSKIKTMLKAFKHHEELSAFFLTLLIIFTTQFCIGAIKFVGDANAYWHYSSFILDLDFPKTMRGYFYPLVLAIPRFIANSWPSSGYIGFYVIQALLFSYIFSTLLPYVFTRLIGGKLSISRRILPPLLVAIFFPGLMAYPLSDLPALCMIVTSLYLALRASKQKNLASSFLFLFLAGITAYGAYNIRTIYLFPLLILIPIIPALLLKKNSHIEKLLLTASFIAGATFASLPQIIINFKHLNSPSPFVITDNKNTSLYANQLKWGVTIQRYETGYNSETGGIYPIYYIDPLGERLFENANLGEGVITVPKILTAIVNHPLSFLRIYTKHFINGMDVRDPDPYTSTSSKDRNFRSFTSLSLSVLGAFFLVLVVARSETGRNPWPQILSKVTWLVLLLLPVLAITPGAIETRFFLPFHLIGYCAISYGFSKNLKNKFSTKEALLAVVIYLTLVLSFYNSARESVQHPNSAIKKEYFE
ncbi:hypothetical protein [Pseudomonas sp. Irchel 3F6]|uniref:hypothetical protein n=1 Tax=Pseudomonas sp. Irchel 3F6 TaxID=2009003 RepID=UPI000BA3639C|nr:hypothetical protein [Pseudomonas sp. Irchel 3F6]